MEAGDPLAPQGWYADPYGVAPLRWWDGAIWTGHTQPRPGWYVDPYGVTALRWWDGTLWTGHTLDPAGRLVRFLRGLPWRVWIVGLVAIGLIGLVCFGKAESTKTPNPAGW